jgi:uncharacterized protein YecT (DUF1311 family)
VRTLILLSTAIMVAGALPRAEAKKPEEMNQHEMNAAAEESAGAADKKLNAVYKKLMAALDDEGKALLRSSQRAWIAYRDAEAKFAEDEMRGGSAAPLLYFGAMTRLTEQRTKELQEALESFGANVASP